MVSRFRVGVALGVVWLAGRVAVRVLCATRGQADMRGSGWPQDHWFVVGCRCLMNGRGQRGGWLLKASSRVPCASRAATDPADGLVGWGLFDLGDRPAESGELSGGGDGDDGAAFSASF